MVDRKYLENLYTRFNRKEYIHPDPIEFLSLYEKREDIEVAGIIASSLAYGRVNQILNSLQKIFSKMAPSPTVFLKNTNFKDLKLIFADFTHRFTTGIEIARFLYAIKISIETEGSLKNLFLEGYKETDTNTLNASNLFVNRLKSLGKIDKSSLIPNPSLGSACKRLNLFFRWMVRNDGIDYGLWTEVKTSKLIIPLDTHMYRVGLAFGFTKRKSADMKTALEITDGFKKINPEDPIKYDFALTRPGILNLGSSGNLFGLSAWEVA